MRTLPLALAATWLTIAGPAVAQSRPANDDFSAAQALDGLPVEVPGDNTAATAEPGEPSHAGNAAQTSVWYRWTAPAGESVSLDTCGSEFDTVLAVYTGSGLSALTEIASSDDDCGLQSAVTFRATAGQEYRIAVAGFDGATGGFTLTVGGQPANDDFASAQTIGGFPALATGSNERASGEPGEAEGAQSVWYRWTAPFGGPVTAQTCGSSFDTLLAVYSGTALDALRPVASNDDGCRLQSRASFVATAGSEYRIQVDGFEGATGTFTLFIRRGHPPRNDSFERAFALGGRTVRTVGTNREATREAGEPGHGRQAGGSTVWYRWRAPGSGRLSVDTCGSRFDTILAVYSGRRVGDLRSLGRDDDSCGTRSRVAVPVVGGRVYRVAVDGFGGAQGTIRLRLRMRR